MIMLAEKFKVCRWQARALQASDAVPAQVQRPTDQEADGVAPVQVWTQRAEKTHVPAQRQSGRKSSFFLFYFFQACERLDKASPLGEGNLLYPVYSFRC